MPRKPRVALYDVRSPGEKERGYPPALYSVVDWCEGDDRVMVRAQSTGGLTFLPRRHFVPENVYTGGER